MCDEQCGRCVWVLEKWFGGVNEPAKWLPWECSYGRRKFATKNDGGPDVYEDSG